MGRFLEVSFVLLFFLGLVQMIMAIGMAIVTKNTEVRKRLGIYGLGVVTFLLGLYWAAFMPDGEFRDGLVLNYFFIGAFGLAVYHFHIFRNRNKF